MGQAFGDGEAVAVGLEPSTFSRIASARSKKRRGSRYVSGWSDHWRKVKNANAPAVRREAEEEWGR
jgi:hypothetical protein